MNTSHTLVHKHKWKLTHNVDSTHADAESLDLVKGYLEQTKNKTVMCYLTSVQVINRSSMNMKSTSFLVMGFETINQNLRVTKLLNITLYVIGWCLKFRLKKQWKVMFCNMTYDPRATKSAQTMKFKYFHSFFHTPYLPIYMSHLQRK